MKTVLAAAAACLLLAGCEAGPDVETDADPQRQGTASVDTAAVADTLMQLSREWAAVAGTGDADSTLSYWAEDAVVMAPGQPPIRGHAAIREFLASTEEVPGFHVTWEPLEAHVAPSGQMAYLIERNEFTMSDSTGAPVTERNKAVTVWERQENGEWKNVVDMWNAVPAPSQ